MNPPPPPNQSGFATPLAGSDVKIVMMTNSQTGLEPTTFKIFSFNNNTHYAIYIIHTCT